MEPDKLTQLVEEALDDLKAVNPVTLDVSSLTDVMDYLVIASGTSNRHVKSLADNVAMEAKKAGVRPLGVEGEDAGERMFARRRRRLRQGQRGASHRQPPRSSSPSALDHYGSGT